MRITAIRRFYLDDRKVVGVGESVEVADKLGRELIATGKAAFGGDPLAQTQAKTPAGSNAMTTKSAAGLVSGAKKEK